jgi:uncharacterized protein (DUF2147 family)
MNLLPIFTTEFRRCGALAIAALGMLAFTAGTALAIEAKAIEGRWRTADNRLIIDIAPRGESFAGAGSWRTISEQVQRDRVNELFWRSRRTNRRRTRMSGKLDLPENGGVLTAVSPSDLARPDKPCLEILDRGMNEPIFSRRMPLG